VSRLTRLSMMAFMESMAAVLVGRGLFFYTQNRLGFTDGENLGLAVSASAIYVIAAMVSHRVAKRFSERRLMAATVAGQILSYATLIASPGSVTIVVANAALGLCNGMKWPVLESYFTAGRTPAATARAVGRFSLSWVTAAPVGLLAAGPLIDWNVWSLFAAAVLVNSVTLILMRRLERRPVHLADDHPDRPTEAGLARCRALLASSRCSMVTNCSLMAILGALMPRVFADLGLSVPAATALAALMELVRGATFLGLHRYTFWHDRRGPLVAIVAALPAGFVLVLLGHGVATVVAGEVIFGMAAGMTYYASLYYSMVVENASVEGGGVHEGLIGMGGVVGPVSGMAGPPATGLGPTAGVVAGVGPLVAASSAGALWFLAKARPREARGTPGSA